MLKFVSNLTKNIKGAKMSEKKAIVFRLKSASNQISRCLEFKMKDEKAHLIMVI